MDDEATLEVPELLLPEVDVWAAAHSNARSEKVVARDLERQGATVYLPLRKHRRVYIKRVRESWIPLFPGYVFYDYESLDRRYVYDTHRVCNILVPDEPSVLRTDLENVARALYVQPELEPAEEIPPGTPVRVTGGALQGMEGVMVRTRKITTLVILVHFINFGAEVTIDAALVEPIEPETEEPGS